MVAFVALLVCAIFSPIFIIIWLIKGWLSLDSLIYPEFESYDGQSIISFGDYNPTLRSPNGQYDISFYQTKASLDDPERYKI